MTMDDTKPKKNNDSSLEEKRSGGGEDCDVIEPVSPIISAYYPAYGYPVSTSMGVAFVPGLTSFLPALPELDEITPSGQIFSTPYGMIYPTYSYDVSMTFAALAFREARDRLRPMQEHCNDATLRSPTKTATSSSTETTTKNQQTLWTGETTPNPRQRNRRTLVPFSRNRLPTTLDTKDITFLDQFKNVNGDGYTIEDIKGNVALLALDQIGSRWLQQIIDNDGSASANLIFDEILASATLLSRDVYGNYIVQKTLQYADQDKKDTLGYFFRGRIYNLSLDVYGCRVVQKLMEYTTVEVAAMLAKELDEFVLKCILNSTASHVVAKCFECIPSIQIDFLIRPVFGKVREIGRNVFGCHVLQSIIENCTLQKLRDRIVEEIIEGITELAMCDSGNYLVQHVARCGGPKYRTKAMRRIGNNFRLFSHHRYASRVVECFLTHVDSHQRLYMIEIMFAINGNRFAEVSWVLDMMCDPYGNYIIQKILEVANDETKTMFLAVIIANRRMLKENCFGRSVVNAAVNMGLYKPSDPKYQQTVATSNY